MKDFWLTLVSLSLTVFGNIITPIFQNTFKIDNSLKLSNYWYLFVIFIMVMFFIDITKLLFDKDKCDLWRGRFYKMLLFFADSKTNEKKYIINDLNSRINLARRELDYSNSILPKLVDVQWIDEELGKTETFDIKEGQFIVKISNKESQDKNIINIVQAVTKRTSLNGIRYILTNNQDLESTIDEIISENIIKKMKNKHILDFYYTEHLKLLLDNCKEKKEYFEQLKNIDNLGMFFRIFLVELEFFSNRIIGQSYREFLLGEIEDFLVYLKEINPEKTHEKVELAYEKAFLKIGILLIKSEKIIQNGIDNYVKAVDFYLNSEFNSFYIIYFEKKETYERQKLDNLIKDLIQEINNRITIEQVFDQHYPVYIGKYEKHYGRCIRFINTEKI